MSKSEAFCFLAITNLLSQPKRHFSNHNYKSQFYNFSDYYTPYNLSECISEGLKHNIFKIVQSESTANCKQDQYGV